MFRGMLREFFGTVAYLFRCLFYGGGALLFVAGTILLVLCLLRLVF